MIEPSDAADLVRAFANTVDLEDETDELATPTGAATWLNDRLAARTRLSAADHEKLLALRTGFRAALGVDPEPIAVDQAVLGDLPIFVGLSGPVLSPAPLAPPFQQALARLAIAWATIVVTGESLRLKRCADDTCGWVFWDVSRNHSRRWCTMRVCGNRAKARRFSARQKESAD